MGTQENMEINVSRPNDKSLEAYTAWIIGLRLARGSAETIFTSVEWAAAWKEYWQEGANG